MRHSALRRIIGLVAVLAFLAVPLNAGLMLPMAAKAAIVAVASSGDGEPCEPCPGCDHGQTAARDCMAMCAGSLFMLPRGGSIAAAPLPGGQPASPMLKRAGLEVSPEPHPPKPSR